MTGRGDEKQEDTTMIKERIPISGALGSEVKQLMEYAGWYEGRSVDISIAEKYYADHGCLLYTSRKRPRPAISWSWSKAFVERAATE